MINFKDKTILVTGGTGFVGQGIVRTLLQHDPKVIRVFSRDESKQFEMMHDLNNNQKLRWLVGDVRDFQRLRRALEGVDYVFHTAALKHVPSCEYNPFEAVRTNVIGIQNLIEAAISENVDTVISMSTDKATSPSNTMGATKLLGEKLLATATGRRSDRRTKFASVRFGNVIGSRGSFLWLMRKNILEGKEIPITDFNMTRFIISLEQAVNLTLAAGEFVTGGDIFLLKMPVVRLEDLVMVYKDLLCEKYNLDKTAVNFNEIGIRQGETLYEDLLTWEETRRSYESDSMYIITPTIKNDEYEYADRFRKLETGEQYRSDNEQVVSRKEIADILLKANLV
jgi:UDP-N-acetylglucosamine 4,6-dehydratase/5-epimerase